MWGPRLAGRRPYFDSGIVFSRNWVGMAGARSVRNGNTQIVVLTDSCRTFGTTQLLLTRSSY
jgi:hypothetical protein